MSDQTEAYKTVRYWLECYPENKPPFVEIGELLRDLDAVKAREEALARVVRAMDHFFEADLEPPGSPHEPHPGTTALRELEEARALVDLAASEPPGEEGT